MVSFSLRFYLSLIPFFCSPFLFSYFQSLSYTYISLFINTSSLLYNFSLLFQFYSFAIFLRSANQLLTNAMATGGN
jgi:hypothetical protein